MDAILRGLENPALGAVYAMVAGILTSASPCALAALPLVAGHMTGSGRKDRHRDLALFVLGMVLSLTLVGVVAGAVGKSLVLTAPWVRWIAGSAFIAAGVAYTGLFTGPRACVVPLAGVEEGEGSATRRGAAAAFGLGVLYGLSASPCSTPALIAILALVATTGSLAKGALLLFAYSAGQSFLVAMAGLATSGLRSLLESGRRTRALSLLRKVGGTVIMATGVYIIIRPWL